MTSHYIRPLSAAGALSIVLASTNSVPNTVQEDHPMGSTMGRLAEALRGYRAATGSRDLRLRLRLQRELADAAEAATLVLRHDGSIQAESGRRAVAAIRIGLEGDISRLDRAAAILEALLRAQSPPPGSAAPVLSETDTANLLETMVENLSRLHDAVAAGDAYHALRAQGRLLNDATLVELVFHDVPTEIGQRVRSALDDLHVGLEGDPQRLAAATGAFGGAADEEIVVW
jgi:hypothetical protein